ncbi:MAG: flagellar basal-body MS-ring/collar protein FliF [Alphaproteobacteria bacterium]
MNAFFQTLKNLGAARLAIIGLVTVGLLGFFLFVMLNASTGDMAILYRDLNTADSAAIVQKLEEKKIPYNISDDSARISVAAKEVGRIRMVLAQDGLPSGGSIGYEIFDKGNQLGATSFVQNINQIRALEGELARTIATLTSVKNARIHLVLPKRELFSREASPASASVFLQLKGSSELSKENVLAIQQLVAAAVPQLKPSAVSVIDSRGNLLAKARDENEAGFAMQNAEEMRRSFEGRMSAQIEDLLSKSLGYGKVRVTVAADLDFDRVQTNTESYDPDQQVVRSTQTSGEDNKNKEGADKAVSVGNALPGGAQGNGQEDAIQSTQSRKEETTNYEIGKTVKTQLREGGQVKRLAVAVLVDGITTKKEDGKEEYAPRSETELKQLNTLVRQAMGYNSERGDTVEVVNMRFADSMAADQGESGQKEIFMGMNKEDVMKIAQSLMVALVAIMVLLMVVRPVLMRVLQVSSGQAGIPMSDDDRVLLEQAMNPAAALMAPHSSHSSNSVTQALADAAGQPENELERMISINQIEGQVRASSLRKIGDMVERHPQETANIIRSWMYQEQAN